MCGSLEVGERLEHTKNVPQFTSLTPKGLVWQRGAVSEAEWHRLSEEGEAEAIGAFRAH